MHTTIQIRKKTLNRLKAHKISNRTSYDEVLNAVLDEVEDDALTADEITDLQEALEQVKRGKLHKIEDVAKQLGVQLE